MTSQTNGPSTVLVDTAVLPTGMDPLVHAQDVDTFAVHVLWQGGLGWTVTGRHLNERLSYKGRKWTYYVERRNRRFYYFPTYEEALKAAVAAVDERKVNGRTWAQWQDHFAAQDS